MKNPRRQLISRRAALAGRDVRRLSKQFAKHFWHLPQTRRLRNLAIYLAVRGEMSCEPIMHEAWRRGIRVFCPVIWDRRLRFARLRPDTPLTINRFRIAEPQVSRRDWIPAWEIDLTIVPMVAFDLEGNRLGMGEGFYDRSFAYLRPRKHWLKPFLAGAAYDFQRIDSLKPQSWDVPMHSVITESGIINVR